MDSSTNTKASPIKASTVIGKIRDVKPGVALSHTRLLQFGVIGYGYWGPQLVRNLNSLPGSSVKFISELDDERLVQAQARYPRTRLTRNAADLFESDVDGVIIATPVNTHYALARAALLADKHVYVEKPLAVKVSEVENLVALAQEHKRVLMVGYTFLYHKAVQELRRIITEGQLGKLYYIDAQRLNLGLFHQDVNVIWDLAPHDLSMLRYLLDVDPVAVRATGAAHIQPKIQDVAYIHLRYADGMIAHLQLSWLHPSKVRRFTVVGDRRMALYDDVEPQDKVRIYNRGVDRPAHSATFEEFQLSYRSGETIIPSIGWAEPLQVACEHFASCIRNGQQPLSTGAWSLPITKTLAAAQRSLELDGQEVAL
jgi:predicted dehydrogenase